ncbi:MAG: hypothetical protein HYV41_05520 [Candidatus Magasanikbacteria bacterium]|nr:hypothetical protein [Candidatus Magasanikbacteria bacterium]
MTDGQIQPTILIKKPDGTSVRVTLDEFKKMRSGAQSSVATPQTQIEKEKIIEEPSSSVPAKSAGKEEPHELATTTPVSDIFINEAKANAWTPEDHRSPLEEDDTEIQTLKNQGVEHTISEVKMTPTTIAGQIPRELMPRFNALVLSYKKGVRSDEQFVEYIRRDVAHGGLGITQDADARQLLEEVQQKTKVIQKRIPPPTAHAPTMTPTESVLIPVAHTGSSTIPNTPEKKFSPSPPSVVHDMVQVSTQQTTSPQDEIRNFSLLDFRRLSKDPHVASSMLHTKFEGWKEDSFLLYMKTIDAWRHSPLHALYIDRTIESYRAHIPIKDFLTRESPGGLTIQEYMGIVEVNGRLVV